MRKGHRSGSEADRKQPRGREGRWQRYFLSEVQKEFRERRFHVLPFLESFF